MPRKRRRGFRRNRRPRPAQRVHCAHCGLPLDGHQAQHCPLCDVAMCLACCIPADHDCALAATPAAAGLR